MRAERPVVRPSYTAFPGRMEGAGWEVEERDHEAMLIWAASTTGWALLETPKHLFPQSPFSITQEL